MSVADLRAVSLIVGKAILPEDLYGVLAGSRDEQLVGLKHQYRRLIEVVHPDKFTGTPEWRTAHAAFLKATTLKNAAELKVQAGTYGDRSKTAQAPDPDPPPTIVEVKKRKYYLKRRFAQGDLCDFYDCTYSMPLPKKPAAPKPDKKDPTIWSTLMEPDEDTVDLGPESPAAFKIAQSAADNDLVENESRVLGRLYPASQEVDDRYFRYLPRLIDSFMFKNKSGSSRRVNVIPKFDDFFSMAELLDVYPGGLDYRDMVWMFKRVLVGLGYVHTQKVVHGALIPPHVLLHPVNHGARIIDWSYAVMDGKNKVAALSTPWKAYYAPEILAGKIPTPATDIFMAAKCAIGLLGGDPVSGQMPDTVPKPVQNLLSSCIIVSPSRRPDDAWGVHDDLEAILRDVVGKPRYRPLDMPPPGKA